MDAKLKKMLIADIKVWLADALEKNDFGSVVRFSSYLESLIDSKETATVKVKAAAKPRKTKAKKAGATGGQRGPKPKQHFPEESMIEGTYKGNSYQAKALADGAYELDGQQYQSLAQMGKMIMGRQGPLCNAKNWKLAEETSKA